MGGAEWVGFRALCGATTLQRQVRVGRARASARCRSRASALTMGRGRPTARSTLSLVDSSLPWGVRYAAALLLLRPVRVERLTQLVGADHTHHLAHLLPVPGVERRVGRENFGFNVFPGPPVGKQADEEAGEGQRSARGASAFALAESYRGPQQQ